VKKKISFSAEFFSHSAGLVWIERWRAREREREREVSDYGVATIGMLIKNISLF